MKTPGLEVADLLNKFGHQLGGLSPDQYKVVNAIKNCRTDALGGYLLRCDHCDYKRNVYHSCGNRACPKCQFLAKVKWVEKRKEDLLPCPYFHVVFTVPFELRQLILQNKKSCYDLLFKASSRTLKEVIKRSNDFDGDIGFIGVLHTWSQSLRDHPHVHYVVPGGTLNKRNNSWRPVQEEYLLPIKILSKVFTGIFLKGVEKLFNSNELELKGDLDYLSHHANFQELLTSCSQKKWVVYCKSGLRTLNWSQTT